MSEARSVLPLHFLISLPLTSRLLEVLDKGKAAAVTTIVETRDKHSGDLVFENQSTVFIRRAGGFGGKKVSSGAYLSHLHV